MKYQVHTVVVQEFDAESPQHAKRLLEDGDAPRNCDIDCWVDSIYDAETLQCVWTPKLATKG